MIYVHLGRYGDILNTLPLLQLLAGEGRVRLVVAQRYADVLDGVSYVEPLVYPGEFEDLAGGLEFAKQWREPVVNLQVYGRGMSMPRQTSNFILEQWYRAGRVLQWGHPLLFDRRSTVRETALVANHTDGRPLVLLGLSGHSSPFVFGARLQRAVRDLVGDHAQVLDLATVKAHRIYDLLALYDRAKCLVAIDTAHQHLAHGSSVPVLALSTDGPTPWHSSPKRQGHRLHMKYNEYVQREAELLEQVALHVGIGQRTAPPRILHVYPDFEMSGETLRRHETAKRTWIRAGNWTAMPYRGTTTSRLIGDTRDLPFMGAMIGHALADARDNDIVLVSNSDVCVVPQMSRLIHTAISKYGAFFTHRWDFDRPVDHVTDPSTGKWYPGSDLFGFTAAWWRKHGPEYPNMIVGAEYVDCILRQLIKKHCGPTAEIHNAVYHEKHKSAWEVHRNSPSNLHNKRLADGWFLRHKTDDLDPFGPAEAHRIRTKRLVKR